MKKTVPKNHGFILKINVIQAENSPIFDDIYVQYNTRNLIGQPKKKKRIPYFYAHLFFRVVLTSNVKYYNIL